MTPKDNEDFAWWILEKLEDNYFIQFEYLRDRDGFLVRPYEESDLRAEIRRLLKENENDN